MRKSIVNFLITVSIFTLSACNKTRSVSVNNTTQSVNSISQSVNSIEQPIIKSNTESKIQTKSFSISSNKTVSTNYNSDIQDLSESIIVGQSLDISNFLTEDNIEATSSNEDVAIVSVEYMEIYGVSKGNAIVYLNYIDSNKILNINVDVTEPKIKTEITSNKRGQTFDLDNLLETKDIEPDYWSVENSGIAEITDDKKLLIKNNGTTKLVATFGSSDIECVVTVDYPVLPYDGRLYPKHEPLGTGIGVNPGRVVWEHNPASVDWSDNKTYWWETNHFSEPVMRQMVSDGIAQLAGTETAVEGWDTLFRYHNSRKNGSDNGYIQGQKIAIKTNMNGCGFYDDDTSGRVKEDYTNPVFLKAFLKSLVEEGGVPASNIIVYDCGRLFPTYMTSMCTEGNLAGIQFKCRDLNGPNDATMDLNSKLQWSKEFPGEQCYLPLFLKDVTYIIDLASLKGHSYGITLSAKNHFGTFETGMRSRVPQSAGVHKYLEEQKMSDYSPLVDLLGNYTIGQKTFLYVFDAFICAPGESMEVSSDNSKWHQAPFNGYWTSSCFFSQDPIALDSVGADLLTNEPEVYNRNKSVKTTRATENYLHEGALAFAPPSGTHYQDGLGNPLESLGVHEHWNNCSEKLYSRNLGKDEGIELIYRGPQQ